MVNTSLSAILFFRWYFYRGGLNQGDGNDASAFEFAILCIIGIMFLLFIYYRITKAYEKRAAPAGSKPIKAVEALSSAHRIILFEKSDYYNKLSKPDKDLFEKRVRYYMTSKMFTTEDGYAITDEMKVLISAAACQISFGLPLMGNSNFTHILIMPNANMQPRKSSQNTIVIPWNEFIEGYAQSDDGQNEGLKVMATALIKDNRAQGTAFKLFSEKKLDNWERVSVEQAENFMSGMFEKLESDERLGDEYFAHAVVYFFELPIAFKQKYPALFEVISDLLGQDTIKKTIRK